MTYQALNAATSSLKANSEGLGKISNNLANSDTNGYKAYESRMVQQVTNASSLATAFSPGGVRNTMKNTVDIQGLVQASNSSIHAAVSGGGFFVVKQPTASGSVYFTRDGAFETDSLGNLKLGQLRLQGWPLDSDENIPAANADVSSLQDVNVSSLNGIAAATNRVEIGVNLDAQAPLGATSIYLGASPVNAATVQTALGNPGAPTSFTLTHEDASGTVTNYTVNIATTDTLANIATTIQALGGGTVFTAVESNGKLVINAASMDDTITLTNDGASPAEVVTLLFGKSQIIQKGHDFRRQVTIYDTLGTPRNINISFKKTNTNTWNVEAKLVDTSLATVASGGLIGTGSVTFGSDGLLSSISGTLSNPVAIPWDTAVTGAGNQTVTFDLGLDSSGAKTKGSTTQFASGFSVSFVNQNGAELGLKTGVAIDSEGYIVANFSNGKTKKLYKLPLAVFSNPNGLEAKTGNIYAQTSESGEYNLQEAGKGGSGIIASGALEMSNVDIGTEFMKMIKAKTGFDASTKVITTSSEMLNQLIASIR